MVSVDFAVGAKVLEILDRSGLAISLAMWLYAPEYEDWRFALSSRQFDTVAPAKAYGLVHNALAEAGFPIEQTPPLMILSLSDTFVRKLRRMFGKATCVEGTRLGGQLIGDRFVQDAIVYRIQ